MDHINKLLGAVALGAAALTIGYISGARAADLGGNCCSDIEERTAELEATTARKGGRKVSLTVSGQVNAAVLWVDADGETRKSVTDNTNSQSKFRFVGDAKIAPDWSAGYLLEIGTVVASEGTGAATYDLGIRHSAWWVENKNLGKVWVGKTSTATDGINEISVANVDPASTMGSLEPLSGAYLAGTNLPYDGNRENVVRYVTPTFSGFTASAAWMANKNDAWDVSLKYAGEFSGIRAAGGIGYRVEDSPAILGDKTKTLGGSASVMHIATGLFVNGSYGKLSGIATSGFLFLDDAKLMHFQAGIEQKWSSLGITTLYGEWAELKMDGDKASMYGFGAVQKVDAAAMDFYAAYRNYDVPNTPTAQTVVLGAVIKF
jgi:predicted porin